MADDSQQKQGNKVKVKVVTSLGELPIFSTEHPVFCDIETQGLYINIRLIQFYQPKTDDTIYILDLAPLGYNKDNYKELLANTKDMMKKLHLVFYNGSYDHGTLNIVSEGMDDLFYAVKTAYCHFQEFSLSKVTERLPYTKGLYKGLDKKTLQKKGFTLGAYLSSAQLKYSAVDVLALARMWEDERIQKVIQNNMAYKVDMLSQRYAIQYQQNGLIVDLKTRNKRLLELAKEIEELEAQLPPGMNVNSYKQVREYLETDKSDNPAMVKYALSDKPKAPKAKAIIELKRAKKAFGYLESINFYKMYTKFNVAGAATGRFTSSGGDLDNGFNAQQIPRQFQKLFKADAEVDGVMTTVVGLDYSTLELRLACTLFGDETMYKQLIDGRDLHTDMAILATGKELHPSGEPIGEDDNIQTIGKTGGYVTKNDRSKAKCINFGYVFGMSSKSFVEYAFTSYGVKYTQEESDALRNKYFEKYPAFKAYHNYVWNNYQKPDFYYETALGRRTKPRLGTDGINGPVQGTGAETTKLAVHFLIKEYPEAIKLIFNVVHDAIYLRVPKDDKKLWEDRLSKAMVKAWEEISKTRAFKFKDIPMPVGE